MSQIQQYVRKYVKLVILTLLHIKTLHLVDTIQFVPKMRLISFLFLHNELPQYLIGVDRTTISHNCFFVCFFRAATAEYGSSQAIGGIRAVAAFL